MKFTLLLFSLFGLLTACSPQPENAAESKATPATEADAGPAGPAVEAPAQSPELKAMPTPAPDAAKTTYQQLQGKWQSTEDAKSVIEIKAHAYTDYYDGKQLSTAAFVLDRACPGEPGAGHPGDNEKFLVQPQEDMCWEIVGVDGASLELSYTARGNSLSYRKMK